MRRALLLLIYNLVLPVAFVLLFPAWLLKMLRRGGYGSGLRERLGMYRCAAAGERRGGIYIHAVSVGEVMIAQKLIATWRQADASKHFVLAATTATGHAVARQAAQENVRLIYAPLDFPFLIGRCLKRFGPEQVVLVESEVWPNLVVMARKRGIGVSLVNARLSARSERRYAAVRRWVGEILCLLGPVGVQEPGDVARWRNLGVAAEHLHLTGSIKFDPAGAVVPQRRAEFAAMLDAFGAGRPVVLAASTHAGEERWIGEAVARLAGPALLVVVPRHAERRAEVKADLQAAGYEVVLRSEFSAPAEPQRACLLVDSTGELRDWTAHASAVVIGKSILGYGGQSPVEAVLAGVPVICGVHMENFAALLALLDAAAAVSRITCQHDLEQALRRVLGDAGAGMVARAREVLARHAGATRRSVEMLETRRVEEARGAGIFSADE
jgi:3-deoxy-D-manno-octulosonic-acid transferase